MKNIHDLEKSVSYPVTPNVCGSVTCDGNENCYNRGRCCWASFQPWSPTGLRVLVKRSLDVGLSEHTTCSAVYFGSLDIFLLGHRSSDRQASTFKSGSKLRNNMVATATRSRQHLLLCWLLGHAAINGCGE